jgi:parallel beta-helix repeat protein
MRTRGRGLAGVLIATAAVICVTSVVRADPLIPVLPELPPIIPIPGAPGAPPAPDPPPPPPSEVEHGDSVPDVCSGGVLKPGGKLQRFVASLHAGETGCLSRGAYEGGVDLRKKGITLRSFPGRRATISGGQVRISPTATGATLKKLRLVSNQFSPLIYASHAVITENEITNRHSAICLHIDRYPGTPVPTGIVIQGNRIHDCGTLPAINKEHGIYIATARDTVIRDNLIYDNADRGIQLYPDAQGTLIIHNVIDGNGEGIIFGNESDDTLVRENIISNSLIRHNVESSESTALHNVVRDNCLWSTRGEYYGGEPANSGVLQSHPGFILGPNTIANPRFENRFNFRPSTRSPCADMGPQTASRAVSRR